MRILFIHQNFPGQFQYLAPELAERGHEVVALKIGSGQGGFYQGVKVVTYQVSRGSTEEIHPWVIDFETKIIRADACARAALKIKNSGFQPDLVFSHPGWGESIFVKEIWPNVRLGIYCEFFYRAEGADVGFDKEFSASNPELEVCRLRLKNVNNLLHFDIADFGLSPTFWQASTFPVQFRDKISVIHDGIDTNQLQLNKSASLQLKAKLGAELILTGENEVVTFVNRNLEPYRGYHIFMRALPNLLKKRPNLRILIIGNNSVSYGKAPNKEKYGVSNWRDIFAKEASESMSPECWDRIHFLGHLPYEKYLTALQISSVHVYLTYPFVLSWSLLEAMSLGCSIVGSDTAPVREVIKNYETGLLVDFFDGEALEGKVVEILENSKLRKTLSTNARKTCKEKYDLKNVCLPKQVRLIESFGQQELE